MSPTAGDVGMDSNVSTTFWSGGMPSVRLGGGELMIGDGCFDVVTGPSNLERSLKVCSFLFKELPSPLRLSEDIVVGGGSSASLRLPTLRRGGGSCIIEPGLHLSHL
jgi:hypothetical protein